MKIMIKLLISLVFVLFYLESSAQTEVSGSVKDAKNKPVASATVTLKSSDGKIAAYSRSNDKGTFTLKVPANTAALTLEVSSLGYKREVLPFSELQKTYNFTLTDAAIDLPTVVINNRPKLKLNGDTLSYQLSDFSNKQDRVLGDVLKKMPGIEVAANGKISYNGKGISNFYIDGDNLLDDKYNIATRTIPKEAVDKVQVIENDQPIKMLRGKSNSDDVALNITIKDEAKLKLIGQASLGAGLPSHFDESANGMMFNKRYKGINYIKANNTGKDPAQDLISHNMSDYLKRLDGSKPNAMLSSGAAGVPDLPQNRYLFNRAGLINVNNLFNLRKEVQLKTNIYYMKDRQQRDYNKYTEIYLPTGDVSYSENQNNTSRPDLFHAQANLNVNRDKSYLNNTFMVDYNPVNYQVGLITNNAPLGQQLNQKMFDVSNELSYMNTLKSGKIYYIYSYLNYANLPEQLSITPGLNEPQFNNGEPYARLTQNSKAPSYYTNNYFSLKHASSTLVQTYKTGFSLQSKQLITTLNAVQANNTSSPATTNAVNDLDWNRSNLYVEGIYEFKSIDEKIQATVKLPATYQNINYQDPGYALDQTLERFYLNPGLSFKYQTGIENYVQLSYNKRNELGTMDDIYRGGILRNYRSLFANDAPLSEKKTNGANLSFNYKKAITMFFFSLQANYSQVNLNTISSSVITDNLQQRIVLPFENDIESYGLSGSISKYLFSLKTTISAGLSWSENTANQIQNGELLPYKNTNNGFKSGIQTKINNNINFNYSINYNQINSKTSANNRAVTRYDQINQQVELSVTMLNNVFVNLTGEHLYTSQSGQNSLSYLFSDLSARYKFNKIRTDLELGVTNLANIKTYRAVYLSSNAFTSGTYEIPGRIAMLKATFNF
ncbi:carboxypeptidase-like regulatory domain-containing protein [Pedobacter metabolipauper]|uniref:Carboxypeptidase family protein n=1 Tax=Pedobacter metabolipauper TaxID=425513 RepID=A0A4R6SQH1_9SPHI|nr:carboxypeptidase regulatory-like domain-containing protein [Pedobacter metabolipauper]TDQ06991.1 carboxypeptidase family protein [Pedobacter metabolipauper]